MLYRDRNSCRFYRYINITLYAFFKNIFLALERSLQENVYGQHLVQEIVVNALKAHWKSNYVEKPLTLSFHGWPGGGKNYVTNFIIENLYKKGIQSEHVHFFNGRIHFPLESSTNEYKVRT